MKSERIVMGDAPDQKSKSKKGLLFIILAILAIVIIILLIWKPWSAKQPQPAVITPPDTTVQVKPVVTPDTVGQGEKIVVKPPEPIPVPIPEPGPNIHIVKSGECLWVIAEDEYNNPYQWTKIYKANQDIIKDPDLIYPNQKIKIP